MKNKTYIEHYIDRWSDLHQRPVSVTLGESGSIELGYHGRTKAFITDYPDETELSLLWRLNNALQELVGEPTSPPPTDPAPPPPPDTDEAA